MKTVTSDCVALAKTWDEARNQREVHLAGQLVKKEHSRRKP